jgi:hypothetical protein
MLEGCRETFGKRKNQASRRAGYPAWKHLSQAGYPAWKHLSHTIILRLFSSLLYRQTYKLEKLRGSVGFKQSSRPTKHESVGFLRGKKSPYQNIIYNYSQRSVELFVNINSTLISV